MFSRWVESDSCDPMSYSPAGSSVSGIIPARILEWVAISSSRGFFWPQGSNLHLPHFLHWQKYALLLSHLGSPYWLIHWIKIIQRSHGFCIIFWPWSLLTFYGPFWYRSVNQKTYFSRGDFFLNQAPPSKWSCIPIGWGCSELQSRKEFT